MYAPTGGGKTEVAIQFFHWCLSKGWRGAFYTNRRLLIEQTMQRFADARLPFGVRAAGYEDYENFSAPFQLISIGTEWSRVYQRNIERAHECELVVVDEAHIMKRGTMQRVLDDHKARGAVVVGMTATPVGLSHLYDDLMISGSMEEYRACKALVPAHVYSLETPDMHKVVRSKTGEYVMDGRVKSQYTQQIVGSVIQHWALHNPEARPTMAYWPGVPESVWGTRQFLKAGVNWCHVDATDALLDGKRVSLTPVVWREIQERFRDGDIKGISSRYKCREGLDFPFVYQCILATPIGSLASYLQTVGRALRYSPETPEHVIVTDHGGNYLRHGSPNSTRPWREWWGLSEGAVSRQHVDRIRDKKAPEPIRCPKCGGERIQGIKCPFCGHVHEKSVRMVLMADGRLVRKVGKLIRAAPQQLRPDTQQLWNGMFHGWRRSKKCEKRTFNQMLAWFWRKHGYRPPKTLNNMPRRDCDWSRRVQAVEREDLRG